jgi:hypothetical protein
MRRGSQLLTEVVDVDAGGMMGIGDNLRNLANKVQEVAREHPDQTEQALNKAEHIVDDRTGGKHSEQLDKGAEELKRHLGDQAPPRQ